MLKLIWKGNWWALMAKTCSVVDLPLWYAACDKVMCFFILPQQLLMSDLISIFLNGASRMIGLTFSFSFFFCGFARGLSVPRRTFSGYYPLQIYKQLVQSTFQVFRINSIRSCCFVAFKLLRCFLYLIWCEWRFHFLWCNWYLCLVRWECVVKKLLI